MFSSTILKVYIFAFENGIRNQDLDPGSWVLGAGYWVCSQLLGPPT